MNAYLTRFRNWYNARQNREQFFVILLSWAILYGIVSLFLFNPLHAKQRILTAEIKVLKNEISTWKLQMDALNQIALNPLYKQWLNQSKSLIDLQKQSKFLMKNSPSEQWQNMIKLVLRSQKNITIAQIRDSQPLPYNPSKLGDVKTNILQRKLSITIFSNFFSTLAYLQQLETNLPNVHWDSFHYQVTEYPLARVEMELSIFYEKTA